MKRKTVFPKYSIAALIASGVFVVFRLIILILAKFNVYLYLFGWGSEDMFPIITMLCIASLVSAVTVFIYKNSKHKVLAGLLLTVFSLWFYYLLIMFTLFCINGTYFEYSSDDRKHQIVARECAFLQVGWGDIYEKTSFCTMRRVGGYSTDDGFGPFSSDAFYFVWNEDNFELHHSFFGSLDEEYRVVKMEYIK